MAQRWWTFPALADNGKTILVTGLDNIDKYLKSGKYTTRIEVKWNYQSLADGMPSTNDSIILGEATDALIETFKKENAAVLTGIYTGDGMREWIFYVKHLQAFSRLFNEALKDIPELPLEIEAFYDPEWEEYHQMREISYVPKDTNE